MSAHGRIRAEDKSFGTQGIVVYANKARGKGRQDGCSGKWTMARSLEVGAEVS